jgi:hypothetical protein
VQALKAAIMGATVGKTGTARAQLTDEATRHSIRDLLERLVSWTERLRRS